MDRQEKEKRIKELELKISELKKEVDYNNALQLALKIVLNGSYGALAARYFILFHPKVAGTITAEGRQLTKTMSNVNEDYWYNQWHLDVRTHKRMVIRNVQQIPKDQQVSIYGDSISGDSIIHTNGGSFTIEKLYNKYRATSIRDDKEVIPVDFESLNWTDKEGIHYSKVKNIIKHKTSKKKWEIKSGGKEIIVTDDHSLIIFRNNKKIEIKPSEIKEDDEILIHNQNIENNFKLVRIDSVECNGTFDDEYVYDLEMEDESHTFIANDILVHNTDSIFVGFEPAIKSCEWENIVFNENFLNKLNYPFIILNDSKLGLTIDNDNYKGSYIVKDDVDSEKDEIISFLDKTEPMFMLINGKYVKDYTLNDIIREKNIKSVYNWSHEIDFIHGMDRFRIEQYFKDELDDHAGSYGVKNVQDFELEKISESIINIAKKKYIQHIIWEDGIDYDRLEYFQPKGVELVRSSTPVFARGGEDKKGGILKIVNYLFSHPDTFNIKELVKINKELRKEMELAKIDDISMQSSCSKYEEKILNDKDKLEFVKGAHFAVKASAYHNYLLNQHPELKNKYEHIKSGDKIKYYYTHERYPDGKPIIFAFKRGEFPIEFAPEVDYDTQFEKTILSPVNAVIKPLGMPEINKRLSVFIGILSGLNS